MGYERAAERIMAEIHRLRQAIQTESRSARVDLAKLRELKAEKSHLTNEYIAIKIAACAAKWR